MIESVPLVPQVKEEFVVSPCLGLVLPVRRAALVRTMSQCIKLSSADKKSF